MNNEITLTVEGWVARPPQRHGRDSTWVTFRVGSTAWWWDSQGERRDAPTTWFDVRVSQKDLAENVLLSLKNGDAVVVTGRLSQHHWTDREGKERASMQITARSVGPNLRWGKAIFQRRSSEPVPVESLTEPNGGPGPDVAAGEAAGDPAIDLGSAGLRDVSLSPEDLEAEAFAQADAALAELEAAGRDGSGSTGQVPSSAAGDSANAAAGPAKGTSKGGAKREKEAVPF
ncbi:MAG: single-stranded DNA-binding protein [Bifidobacteriaceae bacterium]|nr:single-stranded DNA-binding protein [Bifidobacteriaceae bacterium]